VYSTYLSWLYFQSYWNKLNQFLGILAPLWTVTIGILVYHTWGPLPTNCYGSTTSAADSIDDCDERDDLYYLRLKFTAIDVSYQSLPAWYWSHLLHTLITYAIHVAVVHSLTHAHLLVCTWWRATTTITDSISATISILQDVLRRLTSIDDYLKTSCRRLIRYYQAARLHIPSDQHSAVSGFTLFTPPLSDHYTWWRSGSLLQPATTKHSLAVLQWWTGTSVRSSYTWRTPRVSQQFQKRSATISYPFAPILTTGSNFYQL
jgi:hypothetical protein